MVIPSQFGDEGEGGGKESEEEEHGEEGGAGGHGGLLKVPVELWSCGEEVQSRGEVRDGWRQQQGS